MVKYPYAPILMRKYLGWDIYRDKIIGRICEATARGRPTYFGGGGRRATWARLTRVNVCIRA